MKSKIQSVGRALSAMVMPNIGAFIAWGFLTALFLYPGGWFPNEALSKIQPYILNFLLPILIAGQGGHMIGGLRGRVLASIAIMGCIAQDYSTYQAAINEVAIQTAMVEAGQLAEVTATASSTPMLMAAMIIGPLSGWIIKKFDKFMESRMPAGFEMLINNFSVGIFGMALAIAGFFTIGPFMRIILDFLSAGVDLLIKCSILPAVAIFLEPAKVLFLNNAINHGIFTPIGIEQCQQTHQSIMYMLETNPGPGLGVLLAYWVFSKDRAAKDSAPGAIVIHFFGGIHEIYFPYVLANPAVIIGPIVGNICAITWFMIMNAGLVGPASPGSIIAFIAMSPPDKIWISAIGVLIATGISFAIASPIIKMSKAKSLDQAKEKTNALKAESKGQTLNNEKTLSLNTFGSNPMAIKKIIFACDAGMGSSAMGATKFSKRIKAARPDLIVKNCAIENIPSDTDVVVCQNVLADRAIEKTPKKALLVTLDNFLADPALDKLHELLIDQFSPSNEPSSKPKKDKTKKLAKSILKKEGIVLNQDSVSKEDAIKAAGNLLFDLGYVDQSYADAMLEREKLATTYMGMGLAIPHGTTKAKASVKKTGIVVMQYPQGIDFGEEKAYLIIGIAGIGDEHLDLLGAICSALDDDSIMDKMKSTDDIDWIISQLT